MKMMVGSTWNAKTEAEMRVLLAQIPEDKLDPTKA